MDGSWDVIVRLARLASAAARLEIGQRTGKARGVLNISQKGNSIVRSNCRVAQLNWNHGNDLEGGCRGCECDARD